MMVGNVNVVNGFVGFHIEGIRIIVFELALIIDERVKREITVNKHDVDFIRIKRPRIIGRVGDEGVYHSCHRVHGRPFIDGDVIHTYIIHVTVNHVNV